MNAIDARAYVLRRVSRVLEVHRYRATRDERDPLTSDQLEAALASLCDEAAALITEHQATLREIDVFEDDDEPGRVCVMAELSNGATVTRVLPILDPDRPNHPGHANTPGKLRLCA
ncbi:hypothetical protein CBA19CS22_36855 [Caballeronia novacaledonica]|uniref:Uncharacterized protein n=1 Tax=Caballeronia novacaledonica TaxID=1544861 RepID=A0ACB5R4E2_9BURK|nr:hypothetical protein CBA19CS22_36855 [Caballeronia novacaledonica]